MTYNFDIAYDCPLCDFLQLLKDYKLTLENFDPQGPGGGNPNITVSGSSENISKLKEIL